MGQLLVRFELPVFTEGASRTDWHHEMLMPAVPRVGDSVECAPGWACEDVQSVMWSAHGSATVVVRLRLARLNNLDGQKYEKALAAAGWA